MSDIDDISDDSLEGWEELSSESPRTNCFDLADIISTVEFDHTGNYLATGDKGGRVVLFERNEAVSDVQNSIHIL